MSLVTDLTEDEVAALQVEMQSPANVERLHREFHEASPPCFYAHSRMKGESEPWAYLWDPCFSGDGYEVVVPEGGVVGSIYNRDSTRMDRAKSAQPPAGERPIELSPRETIFRADDGSMIHFIWVGPTQRFRRLGDEAQP
jgi:hypothetical protein